MQHEPASAIYTRVLAHAIARLDAAPVWHEPFSHTEFEDFFPSDIYAAMLANLPPATHYVGGPREPTSRADVRTFCLLNTSGIRRFPPESRGLWNAVAAVLTSPALKRCLFAKLAPDLILRYNCDATAVPDLAGYARPALYREVAGYELPPHPDTLKKVVTMHLYLPANCEQLHLGTALYQRAHDARDRFEKVKQFAFRPNSGYAFVVNNSEHRESWHGRELLTANDGTRNTLLNTFYTDPRDGYTDYLLGEN